MDGLLEQITDWWGFLVAIGGAIGAVIRWSLSQRKSKRLLEEEERKTTEMLYQQLYKLKQKVILNVEREVSHATELAEKNRIIQELRQHCPDCYDSYIKKKSEDGRQEPSGTNQ